MIQVLCDCADISARAFYEPILVTEFVKKHFGYNDLSRGLSDRDCLKVLMILRHCSLQPMDNKDVGCILLTCSCIQF